MVWVVVVAAALALWLVLLAALAFATRNPGVRPGPATGELGAESPAIVDLITGDWRLCHEAAAATLLDLAARGAVTIEEIGPELSLVRLGRPRHELNPYERMVYDHVRSLARDGVVATAALAEGNRRLGRWWRSFRRKVIAEARARGLSQARWSRAQALLLTATAAVPAGAAGVAAEVLAYGGEHSPGAGTALVCFGALTALAGRLNGERGTAEGARAAGYWLGVREHLAGNRNLAEQPAAAVTVWGRHLAYAAALGLAPRAVHGLPVSVPADDRRAWSDYGGMWHVVDVRYPKVLWARRPGEAIGRGLAAAGFAGFWTWLAVILASALLDRPDAPALPLGVLAACAAAGLPICYALIDLTGKVEVRGQIVRLRRFQTGRNDDRPRYVYRVALDDGRHREVKALGIDRERWAGLREGDLVAARIGARLGWVHDIQVTRRSRHATAYHETGDHRLIAPRNLGEVRLFGQDREPGR